ncbi:hypothetical protein LJB71_03420 [Thermomonas sp. S9]|uniref:pirin family protein n=1 Tax=Thermomonas sp. S9 TaxID=2885203 RepID=UPI00216ADAAC|nr:hypothetical protein [Thermomonas sp. S9]MCR6495375.1 hypothetical protein [Thermomonas sp. S9]
MLASPDGVDGALAIRQQARLLATRLHTGDALALSLQPGHRYWLQVAAGELALEDRLLAAGDALGFEGEAGTHTLRGLTGPCDVLVFELPG